MSIPPTSLSDRLHQAVWAKSDTDMLTVLRCYNADSKGTVQAFVDVMMAIPSEKDLGEFCRNVAQRFPGTVTDSIIVHLRDTPTWTRQVLYRHVDLDHAMCAAVRDVEKESRFHFCTVSLTPPLARELAAPTPSSTAVPSTAPLDGELLVVVPVKIGLGLSMDMEALGCLPSVMVHQICGPNTGSYAPTNETSAMTDLEKQFVTDPVLIHLAQTRWSLVTLYTYLNYQYPGVMKKGCSQSDMVKFWGLDCPLRVETLTKGKPYVRHIVTNSGSCPSSGGRYFFKEAPLPASVVCFE